MLNCSRFGWEVMPCEPAGIPSDRKCNPPPAPFAMTAGRVDTMAQMNRQPDNP